MTAGDLVLANGWVSATLEQIAVWGSGGTPSRQRPEFFRGDIPWIKTGELGPKYIRSAEEHISQKAIEASAAKTFPKGSVGIAMYGATIGKTSIWAIDAATNQACAVAQCHPGIFNEFLYYFLLSQQRGFVDAGKGGAQPNISQTILKNWPIALPPAAEQRRIVAKLEVLLSELDNGVDALTTAHGQLKAYRQSVLKHAFEGRLTKAWRTRNAGRIEPVEKLLERIPCPPRPNRWNSRTKDVIAGHPALAVGNPDTQLPEGWRWCQLADIARMESGHTPSRSHPEWWEGNICWIGIADASEHDGQVIHKTLQHTNPDGLANSAARLLPAGTVCISRTASVGYVVVMGTEMATSQDFVNWTPTEAVTSEWLRLIFAADKEALRRFGKGSVHKTIYFPEWLSIHIALPPIEEQKAITAEVERILSDVEYQGRVVDEALVRTAFLRHAILQQAFSGQLVAQDPMEEPASVLLEGIRAKTVGSTTKNEGTGKIVRNGKMKPA